MRKILFIILIILIGIFGLFYAIDTSYDPLDKTTIKDIFGNESVLLKQTFKHDFIGFNSKGGFYEYYEYSLNPKKVKELLDSGELYKYPLYKDGLYQTGKDTNHISILRWTKTPSTNQELRKYFNILYSSTVASNYLNRGNSSSNYIEQQGSLVSYYGGYPNGMHMYIIVPSLNKLCFIMKRI